MLAAVAICSLSIAMIQHPLGRSHHHGAIVGHEKKRQQHSSHLPSGDLPAHVDGEPELFDGPSARRDYPVRERERDDDRSGICGRR